MTTRSGMAVIGFLLMLAGAASAQEAPVYTPPADPEKARESVMAFMKQPGVKEGRAFFLAKPSLSAASERTYVDWSWGEAGIELKIKRGAPVPQRFEYASLPPLGVVTDTVLGASFYGVPLSAEWVVWVEPRNADRGLEWAKWLADMFSFRLGVMKGREAFEKRFQETLAKYPPGSGRPPLTEEARRYRVQAESAVQQRRMGDALFLYGKAVEAAPWWAEGFFNTALLYAEQKQYDGAVRNMKRFLLLEPGHPKAREAQDQIYRWEGEMRGGK